MSTTTTAPPGSGARRFLPALLIGLVVVAAVAIIVLGSGGPRTTIPLDPDNPDPNGGRAVAQVLGDQGVDVSIVRSADELAAQSIDADTTVVVTSTELLGDRSLADLRQQAASASLVLVEPGPSLMRRLGRETAYRVTVADPVPANCDDTRLADLLGDQSWEVSTTYEYDGRGCFAGEHGNAIVLDQELMLLGSGEVLQNSTITRADNAAIALRLLGQHDRVVWYVPSAADQQGGDGVGLGSLLPAYLRPALILLAVTGILLVVWRVRRLGPLASEPLPVQVKAIESAESRGRLYRKAGDRRHAAAVLRRAGARSLADRLGLPAEADTATLVDAVAAHTGRPLEELRAVLDPAAPAPADDAALIDLAQQLTSLEEELHR